MNQQLSFGATDSAISEDPGPERSNADRDEDWDDERADGETADKISEALPETVCDDADAASEECAADDGAAEEEAGAELVLDDEAAAEVDALEEDEADEDGGAAANVTVKSA